MSLFTQIATKLGLGLSEEGPAHKAESNVRRIQGLIDTAERRRRDLTAQLPELQAAIIKAVALDIPPSKDLAQAEAEIAQLGRDIANYREAQKQAIQELTEAEAKQEAVARREAAFSAESLTLDVEEATEALLAVVAEALKAEVEERALYPANSFTGGRLHAALYPDERGAVAPLQQWLEGRRAARTRKARADHHRQETADRKRRWGVQITQRYGSYGVGDPVTFETLELAATCVANDCGVWITRSTENAQAEATARKQIAALQEASNSGRTMIGPYQPTPFGAGSAGYLDAHPTIESHSGKPSGWDN